MASAAAVATDIARSPVPYEERNEAAELVGTITSAEELRRAEDKKLLEMQEEEDDEDDDEDIAPTMRRKPAKIQLSIEDEGDKTLEGEEEEEEEDLFGEEDELDKARGLDDSGLDSGDDETRNDRAGDRYDSVASEFGVADLDVPRHDIPEPSDGELYVLKVPRFIALDPHQFRPETFQLPTTDHHSKEASNSFSAYSTAMSAIRWRRSPTNPSELQSNARILRWSDGSLTLQLATDPTTQYSMPGHPLAPPQVEPAKPTPTSLKNDKRKTHNGAYKIESDSFTFLASPVIDGSMLRFTNKVTAGLRVLPATDAADDALERLQQSLSAAVRKTGNNPDGGIDVVSITEDPELAKKKAEVAEKEKQRAQRRREAQELRDRERGGRSLGKRGLGGLGGGLTVGGLENEDGTTNKLPGVGRQRAKPKRQSRRGEIYSDDEEAFGRRRHTKEDEYDEEDDFVAPSDEDLEVGESEDEGEEEAEDEDHADSPAPEPTRKPARSGTPKRSRPADGHDEDAEGDAEPAVRTVNNPVSRAKRRRVIDDEDDNDE